MLTSANWKHIRVQHFNEIFLGDDFTPTCQVSKHLVKKIQILQQENLFFSFFKPMTSLNDDIIDIETRAMPPQKKNCLHLIQNMTRNKPAKFQDDWTKIKDLREIH